MVCVYEREEGDISQWILGHVYPQENIEEDKLDLAFHTVLRLVYNSAAAFAGVLFPGMPKPGDDNNLLPSESNEEMF